MSDNNNNNDKKEEAQLCLRNCGFYGNPKTNGLCSSCFNKEANSNMSLRQQLQQQQQINNNNNNNSNINNINNNNSSSNDNSSNNSNNKEESPKSNKKRTLDYLDYSLGGINGTTNHMFREGIESTSAPSIMLSSSPTLPTSANTSSTTTTTTTTTSTTSPLKILKGEGNEIQQPQQASSLSSPLSSSPLSSSPSKSNIKCKFAGCGKPIGIMQSMSNKCRCGEHYCGKHIHNHNCTFDYKSLAKTSIAKANPQILANKIVKL